jgi:hypothetical protein
MSLLGDVVTSLFGPPIIEPLPPATPLLAGSRAIPRLRRTVPSSREPRAPLPTRQQQIEKASRDGHRLGRAIAGVKLGAPTGADKNGLRHTTDTTFGTVLANTPLAFLPTDDPYGEWETLKLDEATFSRISPDKLPELLANISPEVSKALFDWLRFFNPGWTLNAYLPGTQTPHTQAKARLTDLTDQLTDYYGSADVVWNKIGLAMFIRGSAVMEAVLDEAGEQIIDIATPDPVMFRFRRVLDPRRGEIWRLCQFQNGALIDMIWPTVRWVAVDPLPGRPTGRPLMSAAPFIAVFLLVVLHDIRRVIQQQGYPRFDFTVDVEILKELMPREIQEDAERRQVWIDGVIDDIMKFYADLEPDDAFIHTNIVKMGPMAAVDANSLTAVDGLFRALERFAMRSLKTNVLLFSGMEGLSEASANRIWEAYLGGIKSVQHLAENLVSRALKVGLRAEGILADVELRFAENRASERFRDAQAESMEITNENAKYQMGYTDQDEGALRITGHPAVEPQPRAPLSPQLGGGGAAPRPQAGTNPAQPTQSNPEKDGVGG